MAKTQINTRVELTEDTEVYLLGKTHRFPAGSKGTVCGQTDDGQLFVAFDVDPDDSYLIRARDLIEL